MKSIKELKQAARGQLIGRYQAAVSASVLVTVIEFIVLMITNVSSSYDSVPKYILSLAISLIVDLLLGVLVMGQDYFYLKIVRFDTTASTADIFYGFRKNIDKAIFVQMVFTAVTFVSSLPSILINLGIINVDGMNIYVLNICLWLFEALCLVISKLYFGLSFYILCDHPGYDVKRVLFESVRLMKNQKGRLFLTCLSLIPLAVVSALAFGIGVIWFVPVWQTVLADFYLDAIGEEPAKTPKTPEPDRPDFSI